MTMYLALFRNGQAAVTSSLSAISGMYEDNLYLSTLYDYLETPVAPPHGAGLKGPLPHDGIRFERVSFRSAEHTSELQSLMRISHAVFCLKKKTKERYN